MNPERAEEQVGMGSNPLGRITSIRRPSGRGAAVGAVALAVVVGLIGYLTLGGSGGGSGGSQNAADFVVHCDEVRLSSCLMKQPATVVPGSGAWASNASPSGQDFAAEFFRNTQEASSVAANLKATDLQATAHAAWTTAATQGPSVDVVVLRFPDAQHAQAAALHLNGVALSSSEADGHTQAIPGIPGEAYLQSLSGSVVTRYAAAVGNLAMALSVTTTGGDVDYGDLKTWTTAQYRSLQTATVPPAPARMVDASTTSCAAKLKTCLITPPTGSHAWGNAWGGNAAPTVAQFALEMYTGTNTGVAEAEAMLESQGVTGIVHESWYAANGDEADMVLLDFTKPQGAKSRADQQLYGNTGTPFAVPGSGAGSAGGRYLTTADSQGMHLYWVFGYVGTVAVELHGFSKSATAQAEMTKWAQTQIAKLAAATTADSIPQPALAIPSGAPSGSASAPATATVPAAPPATATAATPSAACTTALDCLTQPPPDSTTLPTPGYETATSPTVTQFVDYYYSANAATEARSLTAMGLQSVAHREWVTSDGDQVDVAILTFGAAVQARAESMLFLGDVYAAGQGVSVPVPGSLGVVRSMQDNGFVETELAGYAGRYEIRVHVWSPAYPNLAEALARYEGQVAALGG